MTRELKPDQSQAPLYDGIVAYANSAVIPFHTPGHKLGRGRQMSSLIQALGTKALAMDASDEVEAIGVDHEVNTLRAEAEQLLAKAYGASRSFFLVNGTSQGIQAAFLALGSVGGAEKSFRKGHRVLVPRNSHVSVYQGLLLSGLEPEFIPFRYDAQWGITLPPTPETITQRLQEGGSYQGVLVTRPDYVGLCLDLEPVVSEAHQRRVPVIVDEAHGPHMAFSSLLPSQSLDLGADLVVQSPHKLGGALTGGSYLHVRGGYICPQRVADALALITSTSPSHLLLASLDEARRQLATTGSQWLKETIELAEYARQAINQTGDLRCMDSHQARALAVDYDPTKLLVDVSALGLSGSRAEEILRREFGIQVEMATTNCILALITIGDTPETVNQLITALGKLRGYRALGEEGSQRLQEQTLQSWPQPQASELSAQGAYWSDKEPVEYIASVGRIAAEWVIPYPPGIPLLAPGELITVEIVDYLQELQACGVSIRGLSGPDGNLLPVVV